MATIKSRSEYTILAAGATKNYTLSDGVDIYEVTPDGGAVTLVASMIFSTADTPKKGTYLEFIYKGGVTSDSGSGIVVTFFGVSLTDAQALRRAKIICYYDGTAWEVIINSIP